MTDPNSQWDAAFFVADVAVTGKYILGGLLDITFNNNSGFGIFSTFADFEIVVTRGINTVQRIPIRVTGGFVASSGSTNASRTIGGNTPIQLQAGDKVFVSYISSSGQSGSIVAPFLLFSSWTANTIDVNIGSLFSLRLADTISGGDTIDVAKYVAGGQTIKEFMLGLTKMFNLYFEFKPNGVLKIEPRDEFYTNEVKDLTPKLAVDREFIIKPLEQSKYKFYQYKYKDSKDRLHKAHQDNYGESFGQTIIQIDNYFTKGVKTIEIPFKIPILANEGGVEYLENMPPIPTVMNDNGKGIWEGDSIPIIALYGGLIATAQNYLILDVDLTIYPQTEYPFAGYIDNPNTPTFDLCFDLPAAIYYKREGLNQATILLNGQLYKQFHEVEIQELTNRNSKIVECFIQMDAALYSQMSFRKAYFIRNAYYRLYEIEAFDPESNDPTKCVFLKLSSFSKSATSLQDDFVDNTGGGGDPFPNSFVDTGNGNNVGENSLVAGLDNQPSVPNNVVLIGYNFVEITDDGFEYTYTGMEGSPFYIIINATGVDITLFNSPINSGKIVNISSASGFELNDVDVGSGYHVYFCNSLGNWIKIN